MLITLPDFTPDDAICLTQRILDAIPFDLNTSMYAIDQGTPMSAFISSYYRYTTCTECEQYEVEQDARYQTFLELQSAASDVSQECKIFTETHGVDYVIWDDSCSVENTECNQHYFIDVCKIKVLKQIKVPLFVQILML